MVSQTGHLSTLGGGLIDIRGEHVGLVPSAVSVEYRGGSDGMAVRVYTIGSGQCVVVEPGAAIRCPAAPGIGANYTFVVMVDGGASSASASTLSYARPMVSKVQLESGQVASTEGGESVLLLGVSAMTRRGPVLDEKEWWGCGGGGGEGVRRMG